MLSASNKHTRHLQTGAGNKGNTFVYVNVQSGPFTLKICLFSLNKVVHYKMYTLITDHY